MKNYLNTLSEREKRLVIAASVCIIFYLYYLVLYEPLTQRTTEAQNQLLEKKETLQWMKVTQKQMQARTIKKSIDNSQLLTLIASQLKKNAQLNFPYQLQQTGSGDIQLSFDKVPFKLFLTWLEQLNNSYMLRIKQFDAEPTKIAGVTKVMLILGVGIYGTGLYSTA